MKSRSHKICFRFIPFLALIFSVASPVFGQNYNRKTFTTENGLSHNNVREMVYDSSGFLWVATWDGLCRYDGYEFRQYSHTPGDTTSLPFFSVNRVMVDGSDNIWVLTDNGVAARFDRSTNTFSRISRLNGVNIPPAPRMTCDDQGNIWLVCLTEMVRIDHESGKMKIYKIADPGKDNIPDLAIILSVRILHNTMWLTGNKSFRAEIDDTRNEIRILKSYKLVKEELPLEKVISNYDHAYWFSICPDIKGNTWFLSNIGLFLLDETKGEIREYKGEVPFRDFIGKGPFLWGNQAGGFTIYRKGDDSLISFPASEVQLLKNIISGDRDVLWYSNTSFAGNPLGLTRIIFTPGFFHKYNVDTETDKLPAVYSVTVDNQKRVWLGIRGRDHLVVITPDNKIIKKYTPASSLPGYYGPARSIKRAANGLWIGFFREMLLFYDYKSDTFTEYKAGSAQYRAIEVRNDGKLYIGHTELMLYDPVTNKKRIILDSLSEGGNFRFVIGRDSVLWGGISGGKIIRYDPKSDIAKEISQPIISNNTEDICPVEDGYIWLAMLGGGLVKFNPETGDRKVYTTSDGLSNNTVYSILRDKQGYIWASTDNGISRLNPNTGIIKTFGLSEGLDIVEFNSGASFIDDDGRFYFGGMGGAVSFDPDSINAQGSDSFEQKILLSALTVSGVRKILPTPIYKTDTLILEKGEDNFHLTIAISDFTSSGKTNYRYRLIGHDDMWINTDHQNRNINYDNLGPGKYYLEVQATDRNGEWGKTKTLFIRIKPFFYQTKTFIIFIGLFMFGLFHLIISLYLRNLRNKARQAQDELRLEALRGQMNPHFIFNSLNSINYFISNNDKISANRYIADFSRLIRTILSNMGSDYVPFSVEIGSIKDYLEIEHLRFGDKFDFAVDTRGLDEIESLHVFPGLIQPFIENAIWHGVRALENRKGFIRVKVTMINRNKLSCLIEDDGIGRSASAEIQKKNGNHNSRGIGIVMERLQIISKMRGMNYGLEISDLYPGKINTGTRVKIDMPVKHK